MDSLMVTLATDTPGTGCTPPESVYTEGPVAIRSTTGHAAEPPLPIRAGSSHSARADGCTVDGQGNT